ncbi:hypothetical protein LTS18_013831, partial [Coniosporium uncinatum]
MELDGQSSTTQWLNFLFFSERFPSPILETALHAFHRVTEPNTTRKSVAARPNKSSLKQRLCDAVSSKVQMKETAYGSFDYDTYEAETALQWRAFYGLVKDLHKRRFEVLALAYDEVDGIAWLARAGYISAIRACSEIEILHLNHSSLTDEAGIALPLLDALHIEESGTASAVEVAKLLGVTNFFRSTFGSSSRQHFYKEIITETLSDPSFSVTDRIQSLTKRCELASQVSDEDFEKLQDLLADFGGFAGLSDQLFYDVLDRLQEPVLGTQKGKETTRYGIKSLLRGAQETLWLGQEILASLIMLIVFIDQEIEANELSEQFDTADMFLVLLARLREYNILLWLCAHNTKPTSFTQGSKSQLFAETSGQALNVFEGIFLGDFSSINYPDMPMSHILTYWIRAWTLSTAVSTDFEK